MVTCVKMRMRIEVEKGEKNLKVEKMLLNVQQQPRLLCAVGPMVGGLEVNFGTCG